MLILPERCFHIFEFTSETLKSLMKTLSHWCFPPLCQFDLKCSGQVVFLSLISYRGTQFSHIFLIASLEMPPPRVCLFSVRRWAETPAAVSLLLLPAQVITQKALTEYLKWEFRLQLSIRAVALLRVTVDFVRSFVTEQAVDAGVPAAGAKDSSSISNQRWINQGEDTTSRGAKTERPLLIYGHVQDVITGCSSWFSSNSQQGKKRVIFHEDLNEDKGSSNLMCTDQLACALKDMRIWL